MHKLKTAIAISILGMCGSGVAQATQDSWDSATPWGAYSTSQFAAWNVFDATSDSTPEIAGSGSASLAPSNGSTTLVAPGNIRAVTNAGFTATLTGAGDGIGLFDVYLRLETYGPITLLAPTLSSFGLSGVAASPNVGFSAGSGFTLEREAYWVWTNVVGSALYTFQFGADRGMNLNQLALATVALPVPESDSGMLMLSGIGLFAAIARRRLAYRLS